jgi:hypothetical protein
MKVSSKRLACENTTRRIRKAELLREFAAEVYHSSPYVAPASRRHTTDKRWKLQLPKARIPTDFLTLLAHLQRLPRRVTIRARSIMLLPLSGHVSCKAIGNGIAFHWRKHCQGSFALCCFAFESHNERHQIIGVSGSILGIERQ